MAGTITESAAQPDGWRHIDQRGTGKSGNRALAHDRRTVEASRLALVAGFALVLIAGTRGARADDRRFRPDLGRACLSLQPGHLGPVVGATLRTPGPGTTSGALLEPDALLYYWPYAGLGINFHPPLAGQLNLATHALFGSWMKDIPSRRMASVIEFALTITIGFAFLARRYGAWVGLVMAGSLLLMPRLYGQAHLIDTDIPGLLLWAATALAFWNGLHEAAGRPWRVLVGVLLGLAFVEKMAAVGVLVPSAGLAGRRPSSAIVRPAGGTGRLDRRRRHLWPHALAAGSGVSGDPEPSAAIATAKSDQPLHPPAGRATGPAPSWPCRSSVWMLRRLLGRVFPESQIWGVERPALETWTAILAFAPVVGWLGNPAWWRETLPRLAHYYTLSNDRRGCASRHPDHLLRPDLRVQPAVAQRAGC